MKAKQLTWDDRPAGMYTGKIGGIAIAYVWENLDSRTMTGTMYEGVVPVMLHGRRRDNPENLDLFATVDEAKAFCQSQLDSFIQSICEE